MQTNTTTAPQRPSRPRKTARRARRRRARNGTGCLVRQTGHGKSQNYLAQWYEDGQRRTQSTGTSDLAKAQAFLNARLGKVATGEPNPLPPPRVTASAPAVIGWSWTDAVTAYEKDQQNQKRRSAYQNVQTLHKHLTPVFGARPLDAITSDDIATYINDRLGRYALATVRGHMAILRRMMNIGRERGHLQAVPVFSMAEPDNARQGFFERDEYDAVRAALPEWMRAPVAVAYMTGWRFNSEIVTLLWTQIDLRAQTMTLRTSKNGKPRTFPFRLFPELATIFIEADRVRKARRAAGQPVPAHVFVDDEDQPLMCNPTKGRRVGPLKRNVWVAWRAALKAANVAGRIFHDFRRTAVRNLVHAGVEQTEAMKLTGHTTLEVFQRYNITNGRDLDAAVAKYAQHLRQPTVAEVLAERPEMSREDVLAMLALWDKLRPAA